MIKIHTHCNGSLTMVVLIVRYSIAVYCNLSGMMKDNTVYSGGVCCTNKVNKLQLEL